MPQPPATNCSITAVCQTQTLLLVLEGDWLVTAKTPDLADVLAKIRDGGFKRLQFDINALGRWDSRLMTDLLLLLDCAASLPVETDLSTLPAGMQGLLRLSRAVPERTGARRQPTRQPWTVMLYKRWQAGLGHAADMLVFLGEMVSAILATASGRARFRRVDVWLNIEECGPAALPIVSLISLLVGLILAFVGALQLSLFGAQIYIANLVSLGMTREMGGLMTAIIMAGRTGAAYAAQLGTMRVNEEIDALKTMNLEPMAFLVLPRMLALILIMPLLCLYADLMGIIGGAVVSINFFDIYPAEYLDRTLQAVRFKDFAIGFCKCAVFGVLIALAGCMRGMQCGRSASAVGNAATSAVVTSIVFIVVADAIMTLILNRLAI